MEDKLLKYFPAEQEATRAELGKPFPQEAELAEKSARLAVNALLGIFLMVGERDCK